MQLAAWMRYICHRPPVPYAATLCFLTQSPTVGTTILEFVPVSDTGQLRIKTGQYTGI